MDGPIISEESMAASTFDLILSNIQKSNLNFCIQVSPFSATISLKKSFAKDKSGSPINKTPLGMKEISVIS